MFLIANPQNDKSGETFGVGNNTARIDTFTFQFTQQEAPHMLITHAGNKRRFKTESRCSCCNIGRRAADIFVEGGHIFQKAPTCAP